MIAPGAIIDDRRELSGSPPRRDATFRSSLQWWRRGQGETRGQPQPSGGNVTGVNLIAGALGKAAGNCWELVPRPPPWAC